MLACATLIAVLGCPCRSGGAISAGVGPARAGSASDAHRCCDTGPLTSRHDTSSPTCPGCTHHPRLVVSASDTGTVATASQPFHTLAVLSHPALAGGGPLGRGTPASIGHAPPGGEPVLFRVLRL